jgi:hypothetical protein
MHGHGRDIYFYTSRLAVVSLKPAHELPRPWSMLLDGTWKAHFKRNWLDAFVAFLFGIGEHPSQFLLYYPESHVFRIVCSPLGEGWFIEFAEVSKCSFRFGFPLWESAEPPNESPAIAPTMPRHEPYFFINGIAIVAVNRDPTRKLPKPALFLLDGSWERIFKKPWIEVFADFLEAHGEDPQNLSCIIRMGISAGSAGIPIGSVGA